MSLKDHQSVESYWLLQCQRHQSDTWVCSQCSDPAMIVFCWQCIQQN